MPLPLQTTLHNRYRIDALLGQGGMGAVYRGFDTRLKVTCAIKENTASRQYHQMAQALSQQFEREATILASLHHPNLPRVTDYFLNTDDQYLVMDYVEGEDLATRMARQGILPEREVLTWISQACSALNYLHRRPAPIIHRDIKPANLKITPEGQLLLVDFGLSKVYDPNLSTVAGAKGWSSGYSPPEQYDRRTDARSDQYALAATLFALLTRTAPPDALERQLGYVMLKPIRALNPAISETTEAAVLQAMSLQPDERFSSIESFHQALGLGSLNRAGQVEPETPQSATLFALEALLTSQSQRTYRLTKTQNIVGRLNRKTGERPDLDLSDEPEGDTVSRKHVWINWAEGSWQLRPHTEHKNTIKVNGRSVPEAGIGLQPGDQIQIGGVILTFGAES